MTTITLTAERFGCYLLTSEDGRDILIQTDWDHPSVATTFGWIPCKDCDSTDGTVDCDHKKASDMIQEASQYLDEHEGETVDDPGYFEED